MAIKTKAIVFPAKLQARLIEEEVSEPGADQALVQSSVSHVSTGTESFCYRGEFDPDTSWARWVKYPFQPGYSAVGRVIQVGSNVRSVRIGERVWGMASHRQHWLAQADGLLRVPEAVSDEDSTWSALAFVTQTAVRRAEHALGDTAVLIGLGPLGQLVTQYLRLMGLREILAIDTVGSRVEIAAGHGATGTFEGSAADARPFVAQHTEGRLADVVYDVTGHYAVLPHALSLARDFGKVILLGDCPQPSKQCLSQDVLARQVVLIGTHNVKLQPEHAWWTIPRQVQLFFRYLERGQMRVSDLVTDRFRPEQAAELYARLLSDRSSTLGVLFDWR